MSQDTIGISQVDDMIQTILSPLILFAARERNVMVPLVANVIDGAVAEGNAVKIPTVANYVANDKVAGAQVTLQQPAVANQTVNIDQHKEVSVLIENITELQAKHNVALTLGNGMGHAHAKAYDVILTNLYSSAGNLFNVTGDSGTTFALNDLGTARKNLNKNNVPLDDRHAVVSAESDEDIGKLTNVTDASAYGNAGGLARGSVEGGGMIKGFGYQWSNNIVEAGTVNRSQNMLFHRSAMGIAIQQDIKTVTSYQGLFIAWLITTESIFGAGILRSDHLEVARRPE